MNFKDLMLRAKNGEEAAIAEILYWRCISRFWSSMRSSMEDLMKICIRSCASPCSTVSALSASKRKQGGVSPCEAPPWIVMYIFIQAAVQILVLRR